MTILLTRISGAKASYKKVVYKNGLIKLAVLG